ncbi:MAG: lysophospholipid acyltransferase family protein [Pseudomonadota bacterium]
MPHQRDPRLLVKDLGGLALYFPGAWALNRLPRGVLGVAARVGASAVRRLELHDPAVAREELRRLFGARPMPASEGVILKEALRLAMFNELEVLRYPWLDPSTIGEVCEVEGREHLDAALARGKGAIILIGHFGANQMIMPALGHAGYPMSQLSAPPTVWADILRETRTTPLWEKVLARRWELEQRLPVQHINVFKFLRPAYACLEQNQVLGLAFDGGGGTRWAKVKLLERMANVSTQPAQLWRASGAALLPTVVVRQTGSPRHRVIIEPPLAWQEHHQRGEALRLNMQAFVDRFGAWVARYPDHYLHFLLMRRRVRGTDVVPFFDDYPPIEGGWDREAAARRLKEAGERS